jgi:hypothetical protein
MSSVQNSLANSRHRELAAQPDKGCKTPVEAAGRPLKIGDVVVVFTLGFSGPFVEGTGIIESFCLGRDHYRIKFADDPTSRTRFIHPDWQSDPKRALELLRRFWRSSTSLPSFDDFFPDDID